MTIQELIKQTNEMARAMCGYYNNGKCMLKSNGPCEKFTTQQCSYKEDAEMLIYSGYGKVDEYKDEIERLKANGYRSTMNALENNRDKIVENIQTEIDDYKQSIKQAKIDVLNEVKKYSYTDNCFKDGKWHRYVLVSDIDILIKEVQNAEDKG